jgi:hypothetical protein
VITPLHVFRFQVDFFTDSLSDGDSHEPIPGVLGSVRGMHRPRSHHGAEESSSEGGRNYGVAQRAGGIDLRHRGAEARHQHQPESLPDLQHARHRHLFAPRMQVTINVFDIDGSAVWRGSWIRRCP